MFHWAKWDWEDDSFDEEPDYKYVDVLFDLGDNFSTTFHKICLYKR